MIVKIIVISWIVGVVFAKPTDNCTGRQGYASCGDHKCCCMDRLAMCKGFGIGLTYIPPLPHDIETLMFEGNSLPTLSKESFGNISSENISKLSLAQNNISNIDEDAFVGFEVLINLKLDGNNHIDQVQLSLAFGSLQHRLQLDVSLENIGLKIIPQDMFSNLMKTKLTRLSLYKNDVTVLSVQIFKNLNKLKLLNFGENKIREINNDGVQTSIEHLDLKNNVLAGELLKEWFCSVDGRPIFPKLKLIQLFGNSLNSIGKDSFKCVATLQIIGLNDNDIHVVHKNAFSILHSLGELQFAYMHRSIKEISEYSFNNSDMEHLNFRENNMVIKPSLSKVIFKHSTNIRNLDISVNNMKHLSPNQFLEMLSPMKQLQHLVASTCQLITLDDNFLSTFRNLTELILDGNTIHTLGEPFRNVYSLKILSLQGNSFNVINKKEVSENFMKSLKSINIYDNPFDCTCDLLWFRSMINDVTGKFGNISLVSWPRRYQCSTPSELIHTRLIHYRPTKSSCTNVLKIVLISLVSFLVIAATASVVVFRYRWYLKYWLYKLGNNRKNSETQPLLGNDNQGYDSYVIYNDNDCHFVHHKLRSFMENDRAQKLHIWERDAPAGVAKLKGMVDGIYASEHAIAVISKNSIQDNWVQFQLDVALDKQVELKRDFLILIILEDVDFKKLSKYWCVMLTRLNVAYWCQDESDVRHAVFLQQINKHLGRPNQGRNM